MMKNSMKRFLVLLTAALILAVSLAPAVLAAGNTSVVLDARVELSGTQPSKKDSFTIVMTPDHPSFPMPEGSVDGKSEIVIKGEAKGSFPAITFEKVGIYTYTITQVKGKADCKYDSREYHMCALITNAQGGGLDATVTVYLDDENDKLDIIEFKNVYDSETPPTGVEDKWPFYLAGCALLLGMGIFLFVWLRRKEDDDDEFNLDEE